MKGTDHFKRTIQMYLEQRAAEDELFTKNYRNPAKNIDDCITYILNYVQRSGCNGFSDGEIYGQAVHYYDENEIEVGKPIQCQIAVNHVVELTAEEKAEARQRAIRQYQDEELRKISGLTQGMFVGAVSDNFDERIEQKIFHAEIVVDNAKVAAETKAYKPIPVITDFTDEHGNDCMKEKVQENYNRIKDEVKQIVKDELGRIARDESLKHLLQNK